MTSPARSITDLPDEILLMIWNKLNKVDVRYSLVGANQRFDQLVCDTTYTRSIEFVNDDLKNPNRSLSDVQLDQLCSEILPKIQENIECLTLESLSMARILRVGHYPHLWKLTLIQFNQQSALSYLTDDSPFVHLLNYQISDLTVMIDPAERSSSLLDLNGNIYGRIFSMFPNLVDLHLICDSFWRQYPRLIISYLPPIKSFLPNIIHLAINADTWDDCLYLLDGRL